MAADESPDRTLAAAAHTQAGAFLRAQALAAGFTRGQIAARLASGLWVAVHPGVYCAGTTKRRRETLAVAARLHCGPRAWFSHLTAARLHGIETVGSPDVWLTVPHAHRPVSRPGLVV
ncbi:MAG TPA: hypothetical protein VKP64_05230, partial [Mycobacteriales bacterium]|nr:hypothetical protein [Mycobacteriales bacterium]